MTALTTMASHSQARGVDGADYQPDDRESAIDLELARRAQAGEQEAFTALVNRNRRAVNRAVSAALGPRVPRPTSRRRRFHGGVPQTPRDAADGAPTGGSSLNQQITLVLQPEKPLVISQAPASVSDRKISVEVRATVLKQVAIRAPSASTPRPARCASASRLA